MEAEAASGDTPLNAATLPCPLHFGSARLLKGRRHRKRGLARLFTEAGGTVLAERVLKLLPEGSGWRVVTSTANHIVGKVVVGAEAWPTQLLRPLGIKLPLETERGYHMMLRDASVVPRLPVPRLRGSSG